MFAHRTGCWVDERVEGRKLREREVSVDSSNARWLRS